MSRKVFDQLKQVLEEKSLDALLVTNLADVWYLTGFRGSEGTVIFSPKARWFLTDSRYQEQSKKEVQGFSRRIFREKIPAIAEILSRLKVKRLGLDSGSVTYQFYRDLRGSLKGVRFVWLRGIFLELRARKSPEEIKRIKKAVRIAEQALERSLVHFRAGASELDFAAELEYQLRKAGSGFFPFETIVASGPRGSLPHAKATKKKIKKGELVVIDFGASYDGYFSDLTVTVSAGEPGRKAREIYQIVARAQKEAISAISPGVPAKEVDARARNYIKSKGYGRYFSHGLGHGLGLAVHELPSIHPKSQMTLEPGMVFTIEPGIYLPGKLGVRIEDDLVICNNKVQILSHSNQPLRVFE